MTYPVSLKLLNICMAQISFSLTLTPTPLNSTRSGWEPKQNPSNPWELCHNVVFESTLYII